MGNNIQKIQQIAKLTVTGIFNKITLDKENIVFFAMHTTHKNNKENSNGEWSKVWYKVKVFSKYSDLLAKDVRKLNSGDAILLLGRIDGLELSEYGGKQYNRISVIADSVMFLRSAIEQWGDGDINILDNNNNKTNITEYATLDNDDIPF